MAKAKRVRTKACGLCGTTADTLYRIRHDATQKWVFACKPCQVTASADNPHYTYGGTWKSKKRH
ncbi:MAG: hypothetical protein AAGI71_04345 [Bacteroidota bacterium]